MDAENLEYSEKNFIADCQTKASNSIRITKSKDDFIYDHKGKKYIDLLSGASVSCLGNSNSKLIQVYLKELKQNSHTCLAYTQNENAVNLSKKLVELTPGNFPKKVFFGLSASDAIDGAIKAAFKYTNKKKTISFKDSYHGSIGYSCKVTNIENLNAHLKNENNIVLNYPKNYSEELECISTLKKLLEENSDIAILIIEPILGDGGNIIPSKSFLKEIENLLNKNKIVFCVDETQTGLGRTAKLWACEHFELTPDLLIAAKALGGGIAPISACIGKEEILLSLGNLEHVLTFSGNSASCRVAEEVLDTVSKSIFLNKVQFKSELFCFTFQSKLADYSEHYKIRALGLQIGIEMNYEMCKYIKNKALEDGIYISSFGALDNVLRVHPPLNISNENIIYSANIIARYVKRYILQNKQQNI